MIATIEAKIIATFAIIGLLAITALGGYWYGKTAQKTKDELKTAQEHLAIAKVIQTATDENDALKARLKEKQDEANKVVDFLANSHPSGGLQLPAHSCASKSNAPASSEPAGTGTLPNVSQSAFDSFTRGLDELALEADRIVEQCRVDSDWIKAQ